MLDKLYITPRQWLRILRWTLYAALFLLTSSAELWKRSANCFYRKGFEPAYAVLGGISPHDYALISAAKGLYRGVGGPATMELADPDIVDAEVFRMIVNATLIARYGLPVLDIRHGGRVYDAVHYPGT